MTKAKLLFLLALAAVPPAIAFAQQPKPQELQEYNLKLTKAEAEIIGEALSNMPFNKVAPLFQKLNGQIQEQIVKASAPPPSPAPNAEKK